MEQVVFENATVRIAVDRNLAVVAWLDAPRATAEIREMERAGKRISAQYKAGTALMNVIVSGTPSFSEEVRNEVARITADDTLYSLASAHVLLVQGLVGSAVRAFLSTALLVSRTTTPNKVFGDIESSAPWLKSRLDTGPVPWTVEEITAFGKRVAQPGK